MYVHGAVAGPAGEFVAVLDRGHAADWVVLPWWWQVRSVADVAVVILLLGDVLWRRVHGDVHDQHGDVVHDVFACWCVPVAVLVFSSLTLAGPVSSDRCAGIHPTWRPEL